MGSWAAEALARSGVGALTLIDLDHVAESNINRQVHALERTLGQAKVEAMRERIAGIHPGARVTAIDDFVTPENAAALMRGFDVVIDAIDSVRSKVAIAVACRDAAITLVVAGGAGGKSDPTRIRVADLSRTVQDPLLAKMRRELRARHGYPRDPRRKFGITAVYVDEPLRFPVQCAEEAVPDGDVAARHAPQGLACAGYGSSMVMTASVGLFAASEAMNYLMDDDSRLVENRG